MKNYAPKKEASSYISSDDTLSEDSSFEEELKAMQSNSKEKIEEIKYKHSQYENFKKRLYQKRQELEQDKTSSMWSSLYYTFFNNHTKNAITLNELELRCKFLFNMEKYDLVKDSDKAKKIQPYTNVSELIQSFANKKQEKIFKSIIEKKGGFKKRKGSTDSESKLSSRRRLEGGSIERKRASVTPNAKKRSIVTILSMYNIEKSDEVIASINKVTNEHESIETVRARVENMNHILNNKNSYQIELDRLNEINKGNRQAKKMIKDNIDTRVNERFFIENMDVNLLEKYELNLEEEEKLAKKVNFFTHKVISKFSPTEKLDF